MGRGVLYTYIRVIVCRSVCVFTFTYRGFYIWVLKI